MATLTQGKVAGQFLLSEANFHQSRDNIIVASGSGKLSAGMVLGQITASGKYAPTNLALSDGSQTAAAVLLYNIDATSADVKTVGITRQAEVKGPELSYHASVNDNTKLATSASQLLAKGIVVR